MRYLFSLWAQKISKHFYFLPRVVRNSPRQKPNSNEAGGFPAVHLHTAAPRRGRASSQQAGRTAGPQKRLLTRHRLSPEPKRVHHGYEKTAPVTPPGTSIQSVSGAWKLVKSAGSALGQVREPCAPHTASPAMWHDYEDTDRPSTGSSLAASDNPETACGSPSQSLISGAFLRSRHWWHRCTHQGPLRALPFAMASGLSQQACTALSGPSLPQRVERLGLPPVHSQATQCPRSPSPSPSCPSPWSPGLAHCSSAIGGCPLPRN